MSNKNILTPVDFSLNSVHAFNFSLQFMREHENSVLHLLHVIDPSLSNGKPDDDFIMMERLRNANEELKKFVNEIPHPGVSIIEIMRTGIPSNEILSYSGKNKIDLIIIASHGWTSNFNLTTGKVASKIIELSRIPVICIKADNAVLNKYKTIVDNTIAENWIG